MTDLVAQPSSAVGAGRRPGRAAILAGVLVAAFAAGAALGHGHAADVSTFEGTLVVLLRFMAACKAAGVLGAAALVVWRLGRPLAAPVFAGYAVAIATMAVAPGLIWSLGLIAPGALLFHAGLLVFLVLAACDDHIAVAFGRRRA